MNVYIYSDESGVFDHVHNKYFVFGGLIILGEEAKNEWTHKYAKVDHTKDTTKDTAIKFYTDQNYKCE